MDFCNHIVLLIPDDGCCVYGGVVEKTHYIIVVLLYGIFLVLGEVVQGDQHGGIDR